MAKLKLRQGGLDLLRELRYNKIIAIQLILSNVDCCIFDGYRFYTSSEDILKYDIDYIYLADLCFDYSLKQLCYDLRNYNADISTDTNYISSYNRSNNIELLTGKSDYINYFNIQEELYNYTGGTSFLLDSCVSSADKNCIKLLSGAIINYHTAIDSLCKAINSIVYSNPFICGEVKEEYCMVEARGDYVTDKGVLVYSIASELYGMNTLNNYLYSINRIWADSCFIYVKGKTKSSDYTKSSRLKHKGVVYDTEYTSVLHYSANPNILNYYREQCTGKCSDLDYIEEVITNNIMRRIVGDSGSYSSERISNAVVIKHSKDIDISTFMSNTGIEYTTKWGSIFVLYDITNLTNYTKIYCENSGCYLYTDTLSLGIDAASEYYYSYYSDYGKVCDSAFDMTYTSRPILLNNYFKAEVISPYSLKCIDDKIYIDMLCKVRINQGAEALAVVPLALTDCTVAEHGNFICISGYGIEVDIEKPVLEHVFYSTDIDKTLRVLPKNRAELDTVLETFYGTLISDDMDRWNSFIKLVDA